MKNTGPVDGGVAGASGGDVYFRGDGALHRFDAGGGAGGIPAMRPPVMTSTFVIAGAGSSALGASGLVALGFSCGWHSEIRSFVMSSVANGLKMGEVIRGSKRRLFWAVMIAIVASLVASSYMTLRLAYEYGGINLNPLFLEWGAATYGPKDMASRIAGELGGAGPTRGSSWRWVEL